MESTERKSTRERLEEWQRRRSVLLQMGDARAIEERHAKGQLSARGRLDRLFDAGTFTEMGMWVKHRTTAFGMDRREIPAEGIVTGFGRVNGRMVVAAAEDFTAMLGTFGEYHGRKLAHAIRFAKDKGWPFVTMNDSAGARLHEGMDTLEAYGWTFRAQIEASGIIPQISLLLGPCLGGQAYHPVMMDFVIQNRKTGFMGIAGPAFVKTQTGEDISLEALSGWRAHASKSGQSHIVADSDEECIDRCKELLGYLPSNNQDYAPVKDSSDPAGRKCPELNSIIPDHPTKPYDMRSAVWSITDDGDFMEILPCFATNAICGFARFGGRPAGLVANQPTMKAGVLDIDACDKLARFIRFCDLFGLPLISLVDCPGYLIGSQQDWAGILRHGAKLLFSWADATVPLISVILRKSYAGAHYGMLDKSIGADFVFAWPTARVSIVGAETAASVIFAREIRNADNPEDERIRKMKEYADLYESPYPAAERGYVDEIIEPAATREYINTALDVLAHKRVAAPWRKFSNITL
ncbi:MAG: acyl-CoA carboxylase subunit beta [Chloroflexota bacterium]